MLSGNNGMLSNHRGNSESLVIPVQYASGPPAYRSKATSDKQKSHEEFTRGPRAISKRAFRLSLFNSLDIAR